MSGFNLSRWALGHQQLVGFLLAIASVAGLLSYLSLGRKEDPEFTVKTMMITVGWPGATHVKNGEFGPVIEKALAMPGFAADEDKGTVMTGFARNAVMSVAGTVIVAVKAG